MSRRLSDLKPRPLHRVSRIRDLSAVYKFCDGLLALDPTNVGDESKSLTFRAGQLIDIIGLDGTVLCLHNPMTNCVISGLK